MKRFIILLILVLMCSTILAEDIPWVKYEKLEVGTDKTLEIMSWNIQTFPKHEFAVELSANIILAVNPDVIGLQEIQSAEKFLELLNLIQTKDPESNWQGDRATTDAWDMNLAYLYKGSIISETKIYEIYPDDEKYHQPFPRKPLVLEFTYQNEDYYAINNHLKAKGGKENEARREAAVELIKEYIDTNLATEEVFVLGDMNDNISDAPEDNVFTSILEDPKNYLFTDMEIASDSMKDWSYPYWKFRGHLDHILITNELFDEFENKGSEVRVIPIGKFMEGGDDGRYKYLTDHRPIVLKLVID